MGTHGRQGESWVPKARTSGMRREVKKALGKTMPTGARKEGKERGEKLSSPSQMLEKDGSGERIRRQVGDKQGGK